MERKTGVTASVAVFAILALFIFGVEVPADVRGFAFSMLAGGAIGGFGLARSIFRPQRLEEAEELPKPRARTPEDVLADAKAHTHGHEDLIAEGDG